MKLEKVLECINRKHEEAKRAGSEAAMQRLEAFRVEAKSQAQAVVEWLKQPMEGEFKEVKVEERST